MTDTELLDTTGEQLRLLSVPGPVARRPLPLRRIPAKLRIDEQTRRIGLAGVAEARAILAAQARRHAEGEQHRRADFHRQQAA